MINVSLTSVDLTRDLGVAKVYFSLLDPDGETEPVKEGLQRASGFLRSRLGKDLQIRYVPELRFVHDDSIAHGAAISRLIDTATGTATGTATASHNDDSNDKDRE